METKQKGLRELALFAGAGGGLLGARLLAWRTVCAVEIDPYARRSILARQRDGFLDRFPIWDDVRTFDGVAWRGLVDVVSGGFPCKGISTSGPGNGLEHKDSAMWFEQARIIGEVRPCYAFVENSPALTARGGVRVIGDLTSMGYDCSWGVVSAGEFRAPHERERMWIVATDPNQSQRKRDELPKRRTEEHSYIGGSTWWEAEPGVPRVDDGVAYRVDRLKAIGNGQVPIVAATAWRLLGGE